jgi:general secretion pathway protein H
LSIRLRRGGARRRAAGFTLIELLVVLLLLTITLGLVGLNLGGGDRDRVRDEASRLAALLQTARDEAILQGQVLVVEFNRDGYRFLRVDDKGRLSPLEHDDSFRPRHLPEGMTLVLELDGTPAAAGSGMVLEPSGQLPAFILTLRLGETSWETRHDSGRIRAQSPGGADAG